MAWEAAKAEMGKRFVISGQRIVQSRERRAVNDPGLADGKDRRRSLRFQAPLFAIR
jgi:hypothetical protein